MACWAYRCPACGLPDFAPGEGIYACSLCGTPCEAELRGRVREDDGQIHAPYVIGDELHGSGRKFDWAAGQSFTSKRERKRVLAQKGLDQMSFSEARRAGLLGDHPSPTKSYSYDGQTKKS
jgi:uncharacterized Zn finger protein (UPF0148 family)